jgi:hypothetical protein|tara:strand:- start:94 stop:225 length:132 start_codon:yes stop_codon:yes gene_type:complete
VQSDGKGGLIVGVPVNQTDVQNAVVNNAGAIGKGIMDNAGKLA